MSDGTPLPNNIGYDENEETLDQKVKKAKVKTTGFLKRTLSKGDEPSSKRVVAFISFLAGTIIGIIFSSFCITMFVTPILNNLDATKIASLQPIFNAAIDFLKFFITATFAMSGAALGITGLEKFADRLTK